MQHFYFTHSLKITPPMVAAVLGIAAKDVLVERRDAAYHIAIPDGVSVTATKKQAILAAAASKELTPAEWD